MREFFVVVPLELLSRSALLALTTRIYYVKRNIGFFWICARRRRMGIAFFKLFV